MDEDLHGRISALEAELAALRHQMSSPAAGPAAHDPAVSRRRLLWSGGAAVAGAAGAILGSASPAGAQTPVEAADVTFDATGGIVATNVQDALEEVDAEKAALAGASFTGPVAADYGRFKYHPVADVMAYGAVGDGVTDDAAAIRNAVTWIAGYKGGGTVLIPAGRYVIKSEIEVPDNVDLWGGGGHGQAPANKGTVLLADVDDSNPSNPTIGRLVFRGSGGQSGNFLVHGQKVADPAKGLVFIDAVERAFTALRVSDSATDGLVVEKAQNCTFTQLMVAHCGRDGLVLDRGAGGNAFIRCEFGGCAQDNVALRETYGDQPYKGPNHNLFLHCIMERPFYQNGGFTGPTRHQVNVSAGGKNLFDHCIFALNSGSPTPDAALVKVSNTSPWTTVVTFEDCNFFSALAGMKGLVNESAAVHFKGRNWFNCTTAVTWNGSDPNPYGEVTGTFEYNTGGDHGGVVTRWVGDQSPPLWANKSFGSDFPFLARLDAAGAQTWGLRVARSGEDGFRFQVRDDRPNNITEIQLGDGPSSPWQAKARWRLEATGDGWETPDNVQFGKALTIKQSSTPADPSAGDRAVVYVKGDKLVVAFKDGTTMRYKYLPLTGTDVTWVHSTTAP